MDTMKDTKMQPATDAVIEEQLLELPFDTVMTVTEVIAKLRQFNEWRRCDYGPAEQPEPPNPYEVGLAIDAAVEMIDRLEAAEKELAELRSSMKFRTSLIGRTEAERDDAKAAAENIALKLDYLRSKLETAENAQNDWLRANAPGGWIDNLRIENEALRAENERIDEAMESLLIRCDDSDSAMYGTLSTSFVRDTVRIARGALEESK